jgi:FkbM family methyltransferase
METTPLLQMLRRHRAFASLSLTLLATVSACVETSETNEAASNSNLVSDEALAPRLLQDLEQTTAFVAAFSAQDYEIAEVPELGRFYIDDNPAWVKRELVMNLELNKLENVIPLRFAIGAENKLVEMTPTSDFDGRMFVGKGGDGVELRTIDSFGFSNVSIMKIDVEGFELEVLKGAVETIATWHPAIVIEITGFYQYDRMPPTARSLSTTSSRISSA